MGIKVFKYILGIYYNMKKVKTKEQTELKIKGIIGFIEKRVTPFGSGAKVDCPKKYLGKRVYLVILKD